MNGSWRLFCGPKDEKKYGFIACWKGTFPREVYDMIHSTGRQSDFCKCSNNQLSWVTSILDLFPGTELGCLLKWWKEHPPAWKGKPVWIYRTLNYCCLSWMQRKDQKQCLTVFNGETPYFWTKYGAGEIMDKDLSTKLKWMVTVLLGSGCPWRWGAVFPSVMFPHSFLPVILCKTSYCAMQKNHLVKRGLWMLSGWDLSEKTAAGCSAWSGGKTTQTISCLPRYQWWIEKGVWTSFGVEECWNQPDSSIAKLIILRKNNAPDKIPDEETNKWY